MCFSQFLNRVKWQIVQTIPFKYKSYLHCALPAPLQKWPKWSLQCINPDPELHMMSVKLTALKGAWKHLALEPIGGYICPVCAANKQIKLASGLPATGRLLYASAGLSLMVPACNRQVSKLVFYTQSTITVVSGRSNRQVTRHLWTSRLIAFTLW